MRNNYSSSQEAPRALVIRQMVVRLLPSVFFFITTLSAIPALTAQDALIQVQGSSSICEGESTTLEVIIGASIGPYTVVYSDGSSQFTVNNYSSDADPESPTFGGDPISVAPAATTTYSLVSVQDQFGTSLPVSASTTTITVNLLPTAISSTVNSGDPVCNNTPFTIEATAVNGDAYELWNAANTVKIGDLPISRSITEDTDYTVRAISSQGCSSNIALSVPLEDTPPVISGEGDQTLNPDADSCQTTLPDYRTTVTVSDNCSSVGNISLTQDPVVGSLISDHSTVQLVQVNATDEAGNQSTYSFNVTLLDNQPPQLSCTSDVTVGTNTGCTYVHSGTAWNPTASDNCQLTSTQYSLSGATSGTGTNLNGVSFGLGTTTVTWTAIDTAGLTQTCSFEVTVEDQVEPVVSCVPDQQVNSDTGLCTYTHTGTSWDVTSSDNCGVNAITYTLSGATVSTATSSLNGVTFETGITDVEVTVQDGSSNTTSCSFTITVTDEQDPQLANMPGDLTVSNDPGSCTAVVSWTEPSANDNCAVANLVQTSSPTPGLSSGSSFPAGATTITYTATDNSGNETVSSFTVTVNDTEASIISDCPANIVQDASPGLCGAIVTFALPTFTDNCPGGTMVQTEGLASGSEFPVGVTTNTFEVTDASGNTSSCSFTVTISDTQDPTIPDLPSDITVSNDADGCGATVTWTEPSSTDNCSGSGISQTSGLSNGAFFPVGTTTVTYTATDASGNTAVASFDVTVEDTQLPVVVGCPSNINKPADTGACEAIVSWTEPSANDNCSAPGAITWSKSHTPGSTFPIGTTTVTYVAIDEAGNNSLACSFDVVVTDSEKPVLSNCPTDISLSVDPGQCTATANWTEPSATDNCTAVGDLVWGRSHNPGDSFPVGSTTVTYTATDEAGNVSNSCSFRVVVADDEAPVAVCAAPTIYLNESGVATLTPADVDGGSTDNCTLAQDLVITLSKTTFNCSNLGENTVTMTVRDASGNSSTCQATVTVADDINPTLSATAQTVNSNLNADNGGCTYLIKGSEFDPIAADNCSGLILSYSISGATTASGTGSLAGATLQAGANTISWTVSDGSNTSSPLVFTKTVVDAQAPVVSSVGNQYTANTPGLCGYQVSGSEFDPSYNDNCTVSEVSYSINGGDPVVAPTLDGVTLPTGINQITWTVSDGNQTSSSSFLVTVEDTELPVITPQADITEEIGGGCDQVVSWTVPEVSDNCGISSLTQIAGLPSGTAFPVGTTTVTYRASDTSGNTATMSFTVTVSDLTAPALSCPSGSTEGSPFEREADTDLCVYTVQGTEFDALTSDSCGFNAATNSFDGTTTLEGKELPVGEHAITWTATDEAGNSSSCTLYVRVTDNQDPTFTAPNQNYSRNADPGECFYTIPDTFFDLRNLSDNCELLTPTYEISQDGSVVFSGNNTLAGLQLPTDESFAYSVVWTLSDVNGNTVSSTPFEISVTDNQAPTFDCSGNAIRNIPSDGCQYTITGTEFDPALLSDNCDDSGDLSISYTLDGVSGGASTSLAGIVLDAGVHPVVWSATDSAGNTSTCSFNITVVDAVDPSISVITDKTRQAPEGGCTYTTVGTEFDPVSVSDNCPSYTLTNNQNGSTSLAGFEFPVGITVVVWSVSDAGGNVSTTQFQVEVEDITAPEFTLDNDSSQTVAVTRSTSASNCLYTVNGSELDPQAVSDNCTTENFSILNDSNNYRSLAFEQFGVGVHTINWTVTDNYGNFTTKTLELTVIDDVNPVINCPTDDYTRVYDQNQSHYTVGLNEFKPVASDNCALTSYTYELTGATTGSGTVLSGVQLNEGANVITWTATDTAGNTTTCMFTVNVITDLYPNISCTGDQSRNTDPSLCSYTVQGSEFDASSTTAGVTLTNDFNGLSTLAGAVFPQGTTLVTWTASQTVDGQNYSSNCSMYVFVSDDEDPSITAPADLTVNTNSGCWSGSLDLGTPLTNDNCGVSSVWNNQVGSSFYVGTHTVTWWVEDVHGNRTSDTQTITVVDDDAPTFNCYASLCRQADEGEAFYTVYDHEFNPRNVWDCSGPVTVINDFNNSSTLAGEQFPLGVHTVTWTFTDAEGNSSNCTSTITIESSDPPSVTCRGFQNKSTDPGLCTYTIQGNESDVTSTTPGTVLTYTLSGATSGTGTTTLDGVALNTGTTTVTWTATNGGDTNVCCTYDIHVYDNEDPVISWPADITVPVDAGSCNATNVVLGTPTATDNCDTPVEIAYTTSPSTTTFALGETTVYWTARDTRGNTVTHTQTVTVTDNTAPVISCPTETYYREYSNPLVDYYYVVGNEFTPSVSDNCEVVSYTNNRTGNGFLNGQLLSLGTHTITWTATDGNPGTPNTTTCDVTIEVVDSFEPQISCPADATASTDSDACGFTIPGDNTDYDAVFTSLSGQNRSLTHDLAGAPSNTSLAGATLPVGITTINWTASQTIGGTEYTSTCSFTFTVTDITPPVLDTPFPDVTFDVDPGTCSKTIALTPPTATDNCSDPGDLLISSNAPETFILGDTNVRWEITDEAGNTTVYTQVVTVYDNEAPVIANCPAEDITAEATGVNCQVIVSWPALIATDDCAGMQSFTSTHSPGTLFDVGTTTVTYTAIDNNGNESTCSFDVVVTDPAPTLSCVENQTRNVNSGTCSYTVVGNELDPVSSSDNCAAPDLTWSFTHPETLELVTGTNSLSGVAIPRGSDNGPTTGQIDITWTATDSGGQETSCTFTLTLLDTEAPILVIPGNQTRGTDPNQNYYTVTGGEFDDVSAFDNCGIVTKIVNEHGLPTLDGLQLPLGENTITWEATDDSGNLGTAVFYAYIVDSEAPRLETAPANITADAAGNCAAVVNYTPPAFVDNVTAQGDLIVTVSPSEAVPGYEFPVGDTEVTYLVLDEAGNSYSYSFDITVNDTSVPSISCPAGDSGNQFNRNTDTGEDFYTVSGTELDPPSFSDNCTASLTNDFNASDTLAGATFPIGATEVNWTVTDEAGNAATCTIQVVVTDIEEPVINSCPDATVSRNATTGECFFRVTSSEFDPFDFQDNAGVSRLTYSIDGGPEVGSNLNTTLVGAEIPVGTTEVFWRLYDASDNVSATCTTTFTISDSELPALVPIATQNRNTDPGSGTYTAKSPADDAWDIAISDNCSLAVITYEINAEDPVGTDTSTSIIGAVLPIGTNTITWEATDIHGNTQSGTYQVVVRDQEAPVAACNPITVELATNGSYTLDSDDIDALSLGSSDPGGIASIEVTPNSFSCVDVGENTVTLTLTDTFGNESSCQATVTVEDNTAPEALCQDLTVILDAAGNASITAAEIDNGSTDACGITSLSLDQTEFDCTDVGNNTVMLTVTDINGNSSTCTSTVTVVDDVAPVAVCKSITVALDASGSITLDGTAVDNGSFDNCESTLTYSVSPDTFTCADLGANTVTLTVTDPAGNSDSCTAIVTVEDTTAPAVVCQDITIQLDENGLASITAADIDNGSSDACGIQSLVLDQTTFDCSNLGADPATNTVTLTVTDVNGNSNSCTALVTVEDAVDPTLTCPGDQTVDTDTDACTYTHGGTDWNPAATDACTSISSLTYELSGATVAADAPANTSLDGVTFDPGITTVTWTAIDGSGNSTQCSFDVTVSDNQAPTAACQDITLQLDASGLASLVAADIDFGSSDNCGIQSLSASKTTFGCEDFGDNTVTLTVTDTSGNTSTCDATVTIEDPIAPTASCTPITVQLDASGNYTLTGADIADLSLGSSDNCGGWTAEVSPNTFNCSDIGTPVDVTLTIRDIAGNTDTCTTTVTVEDTTAPAALCQDITLQLDASGNATLTGNDINNGSSDACGIQSFSASKTSFTCADLGSNVVTLTVTDIYGNSSTCDATVTIEDNVAPVFNLCSSNQSENTDPGLCTYTKTSDDWDATATDNCASLSLTFSLSGATTGSGSTLNGVAFNTGNTTVTWTATDDQGNASTCSYEVTVTDNEVPVARAQVAQVDLDRSGSATIIPSDIDDGSTDNCSIVTYEISKDGVSYFSSLDYQCTDIGSNTVYLRVTDSAGLTHVTTTNLEVDDTQAPTLDDLGDRLVDTDTDVCTYTHTDDSWNPTDNCDPAPTITYTLSGATTAVTGSNTTLNGQVFEKGTTTVTWTVADNSSPVNSGTVEFDVVVSDPQAPQVSCPSNIIQDVAAPGASSALVSGIPSPSFDDNCAVTLLTYEYSGATFAPAQGSGINELSSDTFNLGTTIVRYVAYDEAGNSQDCTFLITVNALPNNTVIPSSVSLTTTEDLGTDSFTVALPSIPSGNVVFDVASSDPTEGTVSVSQLTFTPANWDTPQTVTVTGVNEDVDDGDIPYTILITTNTDETDPGSGYFNVDPEDVGVTNIDNDTAGITVSSASGPTSEDADTATFTVVLDTEPTNDVSLSWSSGDPTESDTFSPQNLTFTPANWDTPQTITVTGKDDEIADGDVNYTLVSADAISVDTDYDGMVVDDVDLVNEDNDTAGFTVTPGSLTLSEDGTTATYTVVLNSKPATDAEDYVVVVDVSSSDTGEGTVSPTSLTFSAADWDTPQTVTVTGVDDAIVDGSVSFTAVNTVDATSTTDPAYDPLDPDDVTVDNTDNDSATVSIDDVTVAEGNSGTTDFTFTVTHSGAEVDGGYAVSYFTTNGTARAPSDFAGTGGSVSFTSGAIGETQTITVSINGDTSVEGNETFSLVLNSVNAPGKDISIDPAAKTGTGTITNDDNATLSIADVAQNEGDSGTSLLTLTVTLDREVEDGLSVDYTTVDGTATDADSDYDSQNGTLTFVGTPGEQQTIDITINGDTKVELDETFRVELSNIVPVSAPGVAISFADDSATGTLTNDDSATLSITGFSVDEGAGTADFTVALDEPVQSPFTIDFATSDDTAMDGSDYTAVGTTLTFGGANALTQTVTIPILEDGTVEPSEDLIATLDNLTDGAGQSVTLSGGGASTNASATITDNDTASLAINDVTVNEGDGTATFTVTLTGTVQNDFTIDYTTVDQTALSSSDYTALGTASLTFGGANSNSQNLVVPIIENNIAEPTENFTIDLSNLDNQGQTGVSVADSQGLGTITDNDALTLDISGFSVTETEGDQTENFVLNSNIAAQEDILFTLTTADVETSSGSDYTAQSAQSYILLAGETSMNLPVTIGGDLIAEPTETFTGTIALTDTQGQDVALGTSTDTSTILDNDVLVASLGGFTISETETTQTGEFNISTNVAAQFDLEFSFTTADGTALDGQDYTAQAGTTVTLPAGSTSVNIPVDILGDLLIEPEETFTATLVLTEANAQQASVGIGTETATITDDDAATLVVSGFSVDEDAGSADFTITLDQAVQNAFTVDFTSSDLTALAGSDYTASGTVELTFGGANPLVQTVNIPIADDTFVEPTEELTGTLSNLTNGGQDVSLATPSATASITDNDVASIAINDVTVDEDVPGGIAVFTVTLTGDIQDELALDYTTQDGSADDPAVQPSDYTLTSGTLTFPSGSLSGSTLSIAVPIIDNGINEPVNETYTVELDNLSSTGSASFDDNSGLGTIIDDDPLNTITLTGFTVTETDGNTSHNFVATLDQLAQEPIVIDFTTAFGSADGTDITAQVALQYTIPSETLTVNIPVEVIGDLKAEPQESFTAAITIVDTGGQQVGLGTDTATGTINDNDQATLSISGFSVDEAAGTADFTISSDHPIQEEITVSFDTGDDTAAAGSDYTAVSTTLTFGGAESDTQTVSISITDDNLVEPTETLNGILSSLSANAQDVVLDGLGSTASIPASIADNDGATLTIDDLVLTESDTGSDVTYTFTVTHNENSADGPFTVDFATRDVEAVAGADYTTQTGTLNFSGATGETQTISVLVTGDLLLEPTETFAVDLSEGDFGDRNISFTDDSGQGTIEDNDSALLSASASDDTAAEPDNDGEFTLSIGLASSTDTEISYSITGTADVTGDYTALSGSVTIPAGSTSITVAVPVVDDDILEQDESVILTIDSIDAGDSDISIDGSASQATVTILDDDTAQVSVSATDADASEPGDDGAFTITLSQESDSDTTVSYTLTGTATAGSDYTTINGTGVIPAGSSSLVIDVEVLDDSILEFTETVTLTLDGVTGDSDISIDGAQSTADVNITDNDSAELTVSDITLEEGNNAVWTLTLSAEVQGGFTLDYTTNDGTALAGSDYTATTGTITFAGTAGETQTVTVATTDDDLLEFTEEFLVDFSGISNALVTFEDQATATLTDNDAASLSVSDLSVDEGDSFSFTVTLSGDVQGGFDIDYATADDSALDGSDYTANAGTLNFAGSDGEAYTITVNTTEDDVAEPQEQFLIDFNGITNALVTYTDQAIATIDDDDDLSLSIADAAITETEGTQTLEFVITLSGTAQQDILLGFSTGDNTALDGNDFTAQTATPVTLTAGDTQVVVPVEILGDAVLEPTEVFDAIITLDDDAGQPITLADADATATITDNDASAVSISATTQAAEPNLAGVFTLSLTEAASEDTEVSYSVTGTASPDVDYVSLNETVTIPAGSTVATIAVNVLDDTVLEGTETVVVTLTGTDNLVGLGTEMEATVNITDDDTSEVSLVSDTDAAEPATDGSFTISLSNPVSSDTQIFYSIGGTAAPATDYTALSSTVTIPAGSTSATLPVEVIDDNTVEGDESVILTLTATGNAVVLSAADEATVTIADDDFSAVTVSATTLGAEPDQDGLFTIALSKPAAQPTTISYTVSGSATAGADYTTLSGTIVVLAGATTATLPVEVLDDLQLEGDETVIVQLTGTDNDVSLGADTEAVITIADNEVSALTVTVANDAAEPDQDGAFRFELTTPVAGPTTVSYSLDGSATADDDYVALSGTLIIPAGDTEFILPLNVVDDVWIEGTETAVLTLTGTDNLVNLGASFEATMNIADDDESSVSVTAVEQAGEPDADGQFELNLSKPVAGDTEVFYTVGGTATPDVDYDALSGTALFPAGSTSILLDISVIDDLILEGNESVILTLTGTNNAVTLDAASEGTIALTDNDSSVVTVAAGMDASEPDNNGSFVLSLSNPVATDTEISYSLAGTSQPDFDYAMLPGTVVIPAGSTSITIEVGVLDDTILEETETIEINLTGTDNAVALGGSSSASINLFDDDASVVSVSTVSDGAEPDSDGRFVLSLSNPVSSDTEVTYTLDGSATEGVDFTAKTGTAVIPAGATSMEVEIEVIDDLEIEGTETVGITLTQTDNAVTLGAQATASLEIADNDQSVVTVVAVADGSEPDQDGAFAILLDTAAEVDTEVTYTISGTATADADYTALSGTLTLPAGTTRIELPVEVLDDNLLEFGGETVILNLTAGDGLLQIGDPSEATVRIADNEGVDAGIELIKTVSMEGDGEPGDRLLYTFLIRNTGNVPLEWIEIDDDMLSETPIGVPGVLPAGQETTINVEYTLTQADVDAGSVTNSAFVFGTETLENTTVTDTSDNGIAEDGDDNPTVIDMVREPSLAIVKTATLNDENQDGFAQVGETIGYRFRLTNTGNVTLTNVYVVDPLDGITMSGQPISLAPGDTDEVTFSALYPLSIDDIRAQQVSNQAQAFGTSPSGQVVNDYSDDDDTFGDTPTVTELSGCELEVFNGVSPNIDGGNDLFFVQGIECYPNNTVEIYNRWGALIFERDGYNNYDQAFTGISEGKATINQPRKLPDGTYFYIIRYTDTDGISRSLTGYLYINRR